MIDALTAEPIAKPLVRTLTLLSTHRLFVGDLNTPVSVQLWRDWETTRLTAEVSHGIRTPLLANIHIPSVPKHRDDAVEGLQGIIDDYEGVFLLATMAGHIPVESWLVPVAQ